MAEYKSNVALKKEEQAPARTAPREWEPFESLRRQVDRMFEACLSGCYPHPLHVGCCQAPE